MTTTINKLNSAIDSFALEQHNDFAVQVRDQLIVPVLTAHAKILNEFIMPALADAAHKQGYGLELPTHVPQHILQFWEDVIIPQPTRECFYGMEYEYAQLYRKFSESTKFSRNAKLLCSRHFDSSTTRLRTMRSAQRGTVRSGHRRRQRTSKRSTAWVSSSRMNASVI